MERTQREYGTSSDHRKNPEALLQRVRLIRNAKEDIILSTFAFQSDESGKLILGALHDAADRGVHVRLLVDGMESWVDMEGNPYFYGLSSLENVEIKLYFFHQEYISFHLQSNIYHAFYPSFSTVSTDWPYYTV